MLFVVLWDWKSDLRGQATFCYHIVNMCVCARFYILTESCMLIFSGSALIVILVSAFNFSLVTLFGIARQWTQVKHRL